MIKQVHTFESARLHPAIAHHGTRAILCDRAIAKADGSACNFLDFAVVPAGADIGIHTHQQDNEEIYIVISGHGLMHLDGNEFEVGPGHVVVNRPGGTHGLKNIGPAELRLVVIEVPAHDIEPGTRSMIMVQESVKPWKTVLVDRLARNPWFSVLKQSVTLPDGSDRMHYTLDFPAPSVGIVVRRGTEFLLIHQYRFIVQEHVVAIPSGGVEKGETIHDAAARELLEETGHVAGTLEHLLSFYPSYGCSNQRFEIFLAEAPILSQAEVDANEVNSVQWYSQAQVIDLILQNRIVDGLSLAALMFVLFRDARTVGPYVE